jgi:valyl-tRNA synthetase
MNGAVRTADFNPSRVEERVNLWITGEVEKTARVVTQAIETYRFNEAAGALYRFVWDVFCDWYLEFIKPVFSEGSDTAKAETRATAAWVLDQILVLAHPFMPFITEELWQRTGETGPKRETMLILANWPTYPALGNVDAAAEMDWVIKQITEVRSVRASMNVPAAAKIDLILKGASPDSKARLSRHKDLILRLARLEKAEAGETMPKGSAQIVMGEAIAALPLAGVIDMAAESARLKKELTKTEGEISRIDAKLSNQQFVSKAPEEVIEEQREKRAEWESVRAKLTEALKILNSAA